MDLARLWVGIDWGVEFHQVCVLDAEGKSLEQRKFFHTSASLMEMVAWLTALAKGEPRSAFVAIERPHGAISNKTSISLLNHVGATSPPS